MADSNSDVATPHAAADNKDTESGKAIAPIVLEKVVNANKP